MSFMSDFDVDLSLYLYVDLSLIQGFLFNSSLKRFHPNLCHLVDNVVYLTSRHTDLTIRFKHILSQQHCLTSSQTLLTSQIRSAKSTSLSNKSTNNIYNFLNIMAIKDYFLSDNLVILFEDYVDLTDNYVKFSELYVDLSDD